MVVLGIDTAGPVVGAALWSAQGVAAWSARVRRKADGVLTPAIAELLAGGPAPELVAVSTGPGAFTGLRVGVAMALGIAVSRDLKVVAVSSLMARAALVRAPLTLAALDARKGRVYAGLFDTSRPLPRLLGEEQDCDLSAIVPASPFLAVGEGAVVFAEAIGAAGGKVGPDADRCPAAEVARIGALCWRDARDPGEVVLRYLRRPDARPPATMGQTIGRRDTDEERA